MRAFEVLHPGVHTALQDMGRPGFMRYGIPISGAADRFSAEIANLLVNNESSAAVLEITFFRLDLRALDDLCLVVTGGDLSPVLNGSPLPLWQPLFIGRGDRLTFRARKKGLRAYLAVSGGFAGPVYLGSRSVFRRGLMGDVLQAGQILETEKASRPEIGAGPFPAAWIPDFSGEVLLRVIPGPQEDRFTARGRRSFYSGEYTLSHQSDRMGYRLQGPPVEQARGSDIISEPVVPGAIQVPGDEQPIILLWDAQVSGGYTKIATVISTDLDRLAQVTPGEKVRFEAVTLEAAHGILRREEARREGMRRFLRKTGGAFLP